MHRIGRHAAAAAMLAALGACSTVGSLGNVLGGVLGRGGSQGSQVSGYVSGVDTRSQIIALQQPNGQPVNLLFDNQTKVVFNNQSYPVTSLDRGDQVTARIQNTNNGYYTDLVQVDQPVQGSGGATSSTSGTVQSLQGTVRQIDQQNGLFTMDVSNGTRLTVAMPYSPRRTDVAKFQSLRSGDYVRIAGVYLNNARVELRQFY
ncbi:MAG: hypothetical protein DMD35_03890 [Gemmatimonadetes bacterium]|nr:MAG: hypothetical protein DMD35_03890 [Gemmatimonadota bacterium]